MDNSEIEVYKFRSHTKMKVMLKREPAWYIKWFSSVALCIGMALTSANMYPTYMYFQLSGVVGWLIVGILWKDRSLLVLNTVGIMFIASGLVISMIN